MYTGRLVLYEEIRATTQLALAGGADGFERAEAVECTSDLNLGQLAS